MNAGDRRRQVRACVKTLLGTLLFKRLGREIKLAWERSALSSSLYCLCSKLARGLSDVEGEGELRVPRCKVGVCAS